MNHKEKANWIRICIKRSNIKARVNMVTVCGDKVIQVFVPKYGVEFSNDEQTRIREIAINNDLTWVRGVEIDVNRNTDPAQMNFYIRG